MYLCSKLRILRLLKKPPELSFPVNCSGGDWSIQQGIDLNDFSIEKMRATEKELVEERDAVAHLLS